MCIRDRSLEIAEENEAEQYANMKTRIKYMYENGDATLLEWLCSAESLSDFLNKADFIQNISDYDRNMLLELQETQQQIANEKQTLENQQTSLTELQNSLETQQAELQAKAEATSTDLAQFQVCLLYTSPLRSGKGALSGSPGSAPDFLYHNIPT